MVLRIFNLAILFFLIVSFSLAGCTTAVFFLVNAKTHFKAEQVHRDIVFNSKYDLKLNIFLPENQQEGKLSPVMMFLYGGHWQQGDKDKYDFVAQYFTERGFVVVIPDYRKYPKVKFPAFVEDNAKAIQWITANIGNYNARDDFILLSGHSAGAFNAAMLTYNEKYLEDQNVSPSIIKGLIGFSGPYDFVPEDKDVKDIFGPPENYPLMKVTNYVDGNEAPAFLIQGKKDEVVEAYNVERMEKAVQEHNGQIITKYYDNLKHSQTIAGLSWLGSGKSTIFKDIETFLDQVKNGN